MAWFWMKNLKAIPMPAGILILRRKRYDIGNKLDYPKATVEYTLRRPELKDVFRTYLNQYM